MIVADSRGRCRGSDIQNANRSVQVSVEAESNDVHGVFRLHTAPCLRSQAALVLRKAPTAGPTMDRVSSASA